MAEEKAIKDMTEAEAKSYAGKLEKELADKEKELNKSKELNTELSDQVAILEKKAVNGSEDIEVEYKGAKYKALTQHFNLDGTKHIVKDLEKNSPIIGKVLDVEGQKTFVKIT